MHFARNTVYEEINSKYVTTRFIQQDTYIHIYMYINWGALSDPDNINLQKLQPNLANKAKCSHNYPI